MNKKGVEQGLAVLVFTFILIVIYILGTMLALTQVDRVQDGAKITRVVWEPGYLATVLLDYPLASDDTLYERARETPIEDEDAWMGIGNQLRTILGTVKVAGEQDRITLLLFKEDALVLCVTEQSPTANPDRCGGLDKETARQELINAALARPTTAVSAGPGGVLLGVVIT